MPGKPVPGWMGRAFGCAVMFLCLVVTAPLRADTRNQTSDQASDQAEGPRLADARRAVARAESLFAAGNHDAALAEFERAYRLMGDDPRRGALLNNMAVCHERAFRYDLALRDYRRYLAEGADGPEDRAEVRAVIRTLEGLLGTVQISTGGQAAQVWVDDRQVGDAPGAFLVPAGEHLVEVRAPLHEPERRQVRVAARTQVALHVHLRRLSDYRGLDPTYFYVTAGTASVLLVASLTLGGITLAKHNAGEALAREANHLPTPETEQASEDIRRLELATDIGLMATALAGAGAAVLYVLTDWEGDDRPQATGQVKHQASSAGTRPNLTPLVGPASLGVSLSGALP